MPKKEKVRQMFDDIAPTYDRLNHLMSLNVDKLWRKYALREIVDGSVQQILDVACGTGDSTISIAKAGNPGSRVTGVDISEGMMALVMQKAAREGVHDRIRLKVADGEDLPFGEGSFHRVTCGSQTRRKSRYPGTVRPHRPHGPAPVRRVFHARAALGGRAHLRRQGGLPIPPGLRTCFPFAGSLHGDAQGRRFYTSPAPIAFFRPVPDVYRRKIRMTTEPKLPLEILSVSDKRTLRQFIRFPLDLYKDCDKWVPAFEDDELKTLGPDNPSLSFSERELFLARRGGRIVGRIAAILNRKANEKWKENTVRFGWFDVVEDFEVAQALVDRVVAWGRQRGCTKVKGPLGFTDMDREGLLVEGFENESPFTVIYNYPYYATFLERMGFLKDADWTQRCIDFDGSTPPMMQYASLVEKRYGLKIYEARTLKQMARRGREMFHVLNDAFAPLYEYSKLTEEQIDGYVKQYVPVLNKDLVAFVVNEKDELVAFTVTMPHISSGVRKAKGRIFPFGWMHILPQLSARRNHVAEGLLIGVLPEYQATVRYLRSQAVSAAQELRQRDLKRSDYRVAHLSHGGGGGCGRVEAHLELFFHRQ